MKPFSLSKDRDYSNRLADRMIKRSKDLETMLGEPKKAIKSMLMPLVISYLVIQLNLFVDTFWTSGLGVHVSSAVSTISPVYWMIAASGTGLGIGASSTIAFRLGQADYERSSVLAGNTLILGVVFSLISSAIVGILIGPVIELIGAGDIYQECMDYVFPFVIMAWALILNGIVAGLLRSEGAANKSMIVLLITAGVNMALDPILIYVLDWGIFGAGMATSISSLVATVLGLYWYAGGHMVISLNRRSFRPSKEAMKEVLVVGGPKTAESIINNIINMVQRVFFIIATGTVGIMLYNVPWRYVALGEVPINALGAALIPVCSSSLGQGSPEKVNTAVSYSAKLTIFITLILAAIMFVFAEPLISVFTTSESMAAETERLIWVLRMYALILPATGFTILGNSILQAMKKSSLVTMLMLGWGLLKLACYAVACQYSFETIIEVMVALMYLNAVVMMILALREVRKKHTTSCPAPFANEDVVR